MGTGNVSLLVTGANGFVGQALCRTAAERGFKVRAAVRAGQHDINAAQVVKVGAINGDTDWLDALQGVDVLVHLAARVHVMHDTASDPLAEFRATNALGTLNLAQQAAAAGVRRFVFLSSVKVNGEATDPGTAFGPDDTPHPADPYGISKHEAEVGLRQIAMQSGMEVVIVRPPLIYGPGVRANFLSMMRWLDRGVPLPLGSVTHNRRSLLALDNLVDLLITCVTHAAAANQTFMVSDGEDLSTTELLLRIGGAMNKPARLVRVPPSLLQAGAKLIGRQDFMQRLLGNLQIDMRHTCATLGWHPVISVNEGLRRTVQGLHT